MFAAFLLFFPAGRLERHDVVENVLLFVREVVREVVEGLVTSGLLVEERVRERKEDRRGERRRVVEVWCAIARAAVVVVGVELT